MHVSPRVLPSLLCAAIACGGDSGPTPPGDGSQDLPAPPGSVTVTIQDFSFAPQSISVKAGTTVRWSNRGPSAHNTTSDASLWNSGSLVAPTTGGGGYGDGGTRGASFDFTFTEPGTYPYHCNLHPVSSYPNFTGTVIVTP
jgi:plastocyanin